MLENEREVREDRRVIRSRRRVQAAFTELLAERDFNKITVQDIAERADINRATFYAHFDDKYDLLIYNVRDELQAMLAQRLTPADELTRDNLRLLALTVSDFMTRFAGRCHHPAGSRMAERPLFMIVAQIQQYVYDLLFDWIGSTQTAHQGGDQVSPQCMAAMLSWMIFAGISPLSPMDHSVQIESIVEQMMAFLTPSLAQHIPGFDKA